MYTDAHRMEWVATFRPTIIWSSPVPNDGLPDPILVYLDCGDVHSVRGPYDSNDTLTDFQQAIDKAIVATRWKPQA